MSLVEAAVQTAAHADIAVVHVGLPPHYESEGYDRTHIDIPPAQVRLIEEVASVQPNTVVVLTNGAAVSMPWIHCAATILETWLGGQAGAGAIADVLLGIANPCGKLAETFPVKYEDCPAFLDMPGRDRKLYYSEGVFVGYRWYDKRRIAPLFPFGHGLSYTTFEYSDLALSKTAITDADTLQVSCSIRNTGNASGKEIVQLYVSDTESRLIRPPKELKGFAKVSLAPGETKRVGFELSKRDFSYFDESFGDWVAESGEFEIIVGASVHDVRLKQTIELDAISRWPPGFDERTTLREWIKYPETRALVYPVVESFFKQQPTEYRGDLYHFNIHNDFFLDMPLLKYVALSRGDITHEHILEAVAQSGEVMVKL